MMLKDTKDMVLFSIVMGLAVFSAFVFYPFDNSNQQGRLFAGLIFAFLTVFVVAFFLTLGQHQADALNAKVTSFLHQESLIFVSPADIYTGEIAAKGCIALTLGKFYFLAYTKEKTLHKLVCYDYNGLAECTQSNSISKLCAKDGKVYELRVKNKNGFVKSLKLG